MGQLTSLGFRIQKQVQNTFIINALPSESTEMKPKPFIEKIIETFVNNQELEISIEENLARTLARRMRIRKGQRLDDLERQELIDKLFACEMPYASPSGKKCFITYELVDVERRLKS